MLTSGFESLWKLPQDLVAPMSEIYRAWSLWSESGCEYSLIRINQEIACVFGTHIPKRAVKLPNEARQIFEDLIKEAKKIS